MANITRAHIAHAHAAVQRAHRRAESMKAKLEDTTQKFVRTLEVGAAAAVGGLIEGKAGPSGAHIMGVPVNLAGALALNLLGYFDAAGKHSEHLCNLGDGLLASYASSVGFGMGQKWASSGKLFGGTSTTATQGAIDERRVREIAKNAIKQGTIQVAPVVQAVPQP